MGKMKYFVRNKLFIKSIAVYLLGGILLLPLLLYAEQDSMIAIAQKALPSIVTIRAQNTKIFKSPKTTAGIDKKSGRILLHRNVKMVQAQRVGAGVIIDSSGLIVTNAHTISRSNKIIVILHDQTQLPAKVILVEPKHDLAFIRVPSSGLKPVYFADSNNVQLGDDIVTVGNSELLDQTISGGKIIGIGTSASGKRKGNQDTDLLQTTINVYKGDSGGPLFDRKGRLVGLMVASQRGKDHSSFAMPSNKIKQLYEEYLKRKGTP